MIIKTKGTPRGILHLKVALIHDWLTGMRGGENVLEVLCEIFPQADIFTLLHNPGSVSPVIEKRRIKTSFIQTMPMAKDRYRLYLPLFPLAIEGFDLSGYDLIVSSSHCVAKGVIPPPGAVHISYIHTPMRYVWDMFNAYFGHKKGLSGMSYKIAAHYLRLWDASSSARVDDYIANSKHVAKRVLKYYRREAVVIHPPVDSGRFHLSPAGPDDYYLIVSAFAPYKRVDTAIEAFNTLGLRLKIIGKGQDEKKLKAMAGPTIEFLGWKFNDEINAYYSRCKALIFPGEEDFGIVPLEAMSSGRPVIAYGKGGALETVIPLTGEKAGESPTGIFFMEPNAQSLSGAVTEFERSFKRFDPASIRRHALGFDRAVFKEKIRTAILSKYEEIKKKSRC